jgi:hypothetical protein
MEMDGDGWRWMEMGATERSQKWAKMLFKAGDLMIFLVFTGK